MGRTANYNLDTPLKRNLFRLMTDRGFNAKSLSLAAKLNATAVRDILDDTNPTISTLKKLAETLGIELEALTSDAAPQDNHPIQKLQNLKNINSVPLSNQVPVYGYAAGSTDRVAINEGGIVEMRMRGNSLTYVRDAFYVIVIGDSMGKAAGAGKLAAVNPPMPLAKDELCLVEFNSGEAVIKAYLSEDENFVHVEQYNPPKKIKYDKKDIRNVYSISAIERR